MATVSLCYQRTKLRVQVLQVGSDTEVMRETRGAVRSTPPWELTVLGLVHHHVGREQRTAATVPWGEPGKGLWAGGGLRASMGGGRVGGATCANHVVEL